MTDKMRKEFETSPRFRGMDFTRSATHPEYYESPYANGAWDGWKASREMLIVLPVINPEMFNQDILFGFEKARKADKAKLEAMGFKVSA